MQNILSYIIEHVSSFKNLLLEAAPYIYFRKNKKFNCNIMSLGHAAERDQERLIKDHEVVELIKSVWSKLKTNIENGNVLINKKDSNKSGSSVAIHGYEKLPAGYLTVIVFPKKYHPNADYYDIEVVTTWKGKTIDSYKEKDDKGKTMYHPEKGQLDIWDDFAIDHFDKKDVWKVK